MRRYGLSRTEPSHAGFNPLKHPWETSGSVSWSRAAPSTNYTALGFLRDVKALMRWLYPILGNTDVCVGVGDGCVHLSVNTSYITPNGEINLFHLVNPEQDNGMQQLTWYQNHILSYIQGSMLLAAKPSPGLAQHY